MDDAVADGMIKRIEEMHPEWDISFLTGGGVDLKHSGVEQAGGKTGEGDSVADPAGGSKEGAELEIEGGSV